MRKTESVLVGFDYDPEQADNCILVVGQKRKNESVEVINAFEGKEALELYKKLITKKERKDV